MIIYKKEMVVMWPFVQKCTKFELFKVTRSVTSWVFLKFACRGGSREGGGLDG